jgi:hypothetical protein
MLPRPQTTLLHRTKSRSNRCDSPLFWIKAYSRAALNGKTSAVAAQPGEKAKYYALRKRIKNVALGANAVGSNKAKLPPRAGEVAWV